jgi:methylglutamate dehydrogenase subunit B
MHQINCPWCGVRDETEFQYQGDASKTRLAPDADEATFFDYVYTRDNPKGWHTEWWHHVGGCRQWVKVVRHTVSHEIHATGLPGDDLSVPQAGPKP